VEVASCCLSIRLCCCLLLPLAPAARPRTWPSLRLLPLRLPAVVMRLSIAWSGPRKRPWKGVGRWPVLRSSVVVGSPATERRRGPSIQGTCCGMEWKGKRLRRWQRNRLWGMRTKGKSPSLRTPRRAKQGRKRWKKEAGLVAHALDIIHKHQCSTQHTDALHPQARRRTRRIPRASKFCPRGYPAFVCGVCAAVPTASSLCAAEAFLCHEAHPLTNQYPLSHNT